MRLLAATVVALALLVGAATPLGATPQEKLSDARQKFLEGDWESTIAIVAPLLYPVRALASADELTEAHIMLGVSYFETKDEAAAEREFEEALRIDPDIELNPDLYSAEVVSFFNELKKKLGDDIARAKERARRAAEWARYQRLIESSKQVTVEQRPLWVNFVPFGVGQFQNGHRKKGFAFLGTELVLGGTSLAMFAVQWSRYGIPLEIPADELDFAARLQQIQIITGVGFFIVYAVGVGDALWYHEPRKVTTTPLDPSLLPPPPEFDDPNEGARPRADAATSHLRLLPMAGPDRAGLVLHWEF